MEFNSSRKLAADVYLVQNWDKHTGTPDERRNRIFQEFVRLGMRKRWELHKQAETFEFDANEKNILTCRPWNVRSIAGWIGEDLRRVMVTDSAHPMTQEDLEFRTDLGGDDMLMCVYDGDPFEILPELVFSMSAFDDPDDVAEARESHDQSLWVTGVFWIVNRLIWVDEFGETIREKTFDINGAREAAEAFKNYRPFESSWWNEATRVGKYAGDEWWL
nr:hypothetical protein CFP56_21916 [Quercus suber]